MIESARLDGASDGKIFMRILLPLIKPQIELATLFTVLNGLKIYDSVVSLTGGGPSRQTVVLPMWIVENAFTYSKFGLCQRDVRGLYSGRIDFQCHFTESVQR